MALKYRRLDGNGDYTFGGNSNDFITDSVEAVAQAIYTRLRLLEGEWWEDTSDGLPLFQQILGHFGPNGNKNAADLVIKERILGTTGVQSITTFESDYNLSTRAYSFTCTIATDYGTTTVAA
jgi:hypothetical protein